MRSSRPQICAEAWQKTKVRWMTCPGAAADNAPGPTVPYASGYCGVRCDWPSHLDRGDAWLPRSSPAHLDVTADPVQCRSSAARAAGAKEPDVVLSPRRPDVYGAGCTVGVLPEMAVRPDVRHA